MSTSYDYVVGAGSAGCALVGTLSAQQPSAQILVIEAGGWDDDPAVADPRLWFTNLGTARDWDDVAIPAPGVNGRAVPEHTGRVVGGGTSINATIWSRPFQADLDHWAAVTADPSWGYDHGLELFRSVEDWQGTPDPRFRGTGGPVWVQPAADPLPLAQAALEGFREAGLPLVEDLNGEREVTGNGFGLMNQIIKDDRRHSMATAFLRPAMARGNVTVLVNTLVTRVVLRGGRSVGVETMQDGQRVLAEARQEVVLAAGGFNTPRLLMLSGIGDKSELRSVGIDAVVHSPELGKNVQDHILHGGACTRRPSRSSTATVPRTSPATTRPTPASSCPTSASSRSRSPTPATSSPPAMHPRPPPGRCAPDSSRRRAVARCGFARQIRATGRSWTCSSCPGTRTSKFSPGASSWRAPWPARPR